MDIKYIVGVIIAYFVLFVLDLMRKRSHKQTRSLKRFTIRTILDIAYLGTFCAAVVVVLLIICTINNPEFWEDWNIWGTVVFGAFFFVVFIMMLAPIKGFWDIIVDHDDITVVHFWIFKWHWKISSISHCELKLGGANVYVKGRRRKAFFVDGMTDHYSNFIKRMEKEQGPLEYKLRNKQ